MYFNYILLIAVGSNPTLSAIPTAFDTAIGLIEDYDDPNERAKMDRQVRNHTHAVEALRSAGIFHSSGTSPKMILDDFVKRPSAES